MIDFSKPVQTQDGYEVRILCTDAPGDLPVVGYIIYGKGCVDANSWTIDGFYHEDKRKSWGNLVNIPEKLECWVAWVASHNGEPAYPIVSIDRKFLGNLGVDIYSITKVTAQEGDGL